MKDKNIKRRLIEEDDDDCDYDSNQERSQRALKQPFYYCMDCGQEFRKKEYARAVVQQISVAESVDI